MSFDDDAMLSRSGRSDPSGKLDRRMEMVCSQTTEERVIAMATLSGMSRSEYLRMIVEQHVYGAFALLQKSAPAGPTMRWEQNPNNGGL